jgi:TRAP transporter TAXI family solute receptor
MRTNVIVACLLAAAAVAIHNSNVYGQAVPKSLQEGGSDAVMRDRKNAWTIGIVGGLMSGSYMRLVDEMASALNDGDNLRILPIVSYGAASNLDDLLYLRGVDAAITQSDVFEYFRTQRKISGLEQRVQYILRLPISELHILVRHDVQTLEDLRGKKVNFGPAGTGASLTGTILFQRLGINVQEVLIDQSTALQKLQNGEVDAIARVVLKPIDYFSKLPANSGFHLLEIPYTKMADKFEDFYTLGEFTKNEYPNLLEGKDHIDTIAVPAVLAVFNWPAKTERYRKVERLVQYLFNRWDTFQHPPYHPKWRDINLAATVPGWTRFGVAEDLLKKMQIQQQQAGVQTQPGIQTQPGVQTNLAAQPGVPNNQTDKDALYREFLRWRSQSAGH